MEYCLSNGVENQEPCFLTQAPGGRLHFLLPWGSWCRGGGWRPYQTTGFPEEGRLGVYSRTGASLGVPRPVKRDVCSAIPPGAKIASPWETLDHKDKPVHSGGQKPGGKGTHSLKSQTMPASSGESPQQPHQMPRGSCHLCNGRDVPHSHAWLGSPNHVYDMNEKKQKNSCYTDAKQDAFSL